MRLILEVLRWYWNKPVLPRCQKSNPGYNWYQITKNTSRREYCTCFYWCTTHMIRLIVNLFSNILVFYNMILSTVIQISSDSRVFRCAMCVAFHYEHFVYNWQSITHQWGDESVRFTITKDHAQHNIILTTSIKMLFIWLAGYVYIRKRCQSHVALSIGEF